MIVVLMGVTGTGKTTVATELARQTGWKFAEGDEYHSAASVEKMKAGVPLTDSDRAPWLKALHGVLLDWQMTGVSGVMTCSALKEAYRTVLSEGLDQARFHFVLLEVPKEVLVERLAHRPGHFMNPALLDSQLATLELPAEAIKVNADQPPATVVADILRQLGIAAGELTGTTERKD